MSAVSKREINQLGYNNTVLVMLRPQFGKASLARIPVLEERRERPLVAVGYVDTVAMDQDRHK